MTLEEGRSSWPLNRIAKAATMNDHPLNAVREARERISAAVDHDSKQLIERCRRIEQQHKGRVVSAPNPEKEVSEPAGH